jgi:transcriptional regulator with XRE-family HTH domain
MARRRQEEARRIGARIAELRQRARLTQEAAAERAKVAHRTYQTWEAGDATPRWRNYERLAEMFDVRVEEILGAGSSDADTRQLNRIEAKVDALLDRMGVDRAKVELAADRLRDAVREQHRPARQEEQLGERHRSEADRAP